MSKKLIVAVDLDGTVFKSEKKTYKIIEPNIPLINTLLQMQKEGSKLIAWTCRDKWMLKDAIEYCKKIGLVFDKINDNVKTFSSSRKIYADIYLDDRAMTPETFIKEHGKNGSSEI